MSENVRDLLIELGTEELPPKSLKTLAEALRDGIKNGIANALLDHDEVRMYATPRRMAVIVHNLRARARDILSERRGPALNIAFNQDGSPTKAAQGFAKSCNVTVDALQRNDTHLVFRDERKGENMVTLIPGILMQAILALPIAKRMRWGDGSNVFVRPLHWLVLLYGDELIPFDRLENIFSDVTLSRNTYGHRFHHPDAISIKSPETYESQLADEGYVLVDMDKRRDTICKQITQLADADDLGGQVAINDALLDEVTALVEWPIALMGSFDKKFLDLPDEVLISSMETHQKYFAVQDKAGALMPYFITVCNIDSKDKAVVISGNERVLSARLSDAMFFYQQDSRQPLESRKQKLTTIVYHQKLGSVSDRSDRIAKIALMIADKLGADKKLVERATHLAKCDLVTDMVTEFPNLQGVMGRIYALKAGETEEVASALAEQYLPRFAGDKLPQTKTGQVLSLADKLEALVGLFSVGEAPTGTRDPFALRRASLGVIRIMIEGKLNINLWGLVQDTRSLFPDGIIVEGDVLGNAMSYIYDRLPSYLKDKGIAADVFSAVGAIKPNDPLDFYQRLDAITRFVGLEHAPALVASHKRINNILNKNDIKANAYDVKQSLFREKAEQQLFTKLKEIDADVGALQVERKYTGALKRMADIQPEVDTFFADVMVMADDEAVRQNRLNLLEKARRLFSCVADISFLKQ